MKPDTIIDYPVDQFLNLCNLKYHITILQISGSQKNYLKLILNIQIGLFIFILELKRFVLNIQIGLIKIRSRIKLHERLIDLIQDCQFHFNIILIL